MVKYLVANLDPSETPLGPVLASTHQNRRSAAEGQLDVGLGWHILHGPSGDIVWHNGGTGGYRSFIGFDPAKRTGVVLLTNSAIDVDDIGFHLLDRRLPLAKPPVARHEVAVDPKMLARYVGDYQIAPGLALTVALESESLTIQATDKPKVRLHAESETDFFIRAVDNQVSFVTDETGQVSGLVLRQPGRDIDAPKVK
jgi:CubicO group peptidase (beta-lactamase class C family)